MRPRLSLLPSAAKALGEKANYSWKTTVVVPADSQFHPGPTEGKTEKDGATRVKMTFGDNTTELVLQGGRVVAEGPPRDALRADVLKTVFGLDGELVETPAGLVLAARRAG